MSVRSPSLPTVLVGFLLVFSLIGGSKAAVSLGELIAHWGSGLVETEGTLASTCDTDGIDLTIYTEGSRYYDVLVTMLNAYGTGYLSASVPCQYPSDHRQGAFAPNLIDFILIKYFGSSELACAYNRTDTSPSGQSIDPAFFVKDTVPFASGCPYKHLYGGVPLWNTAYDAEYGYSDTIKKVAAKAKTGSVIGLATS
ncbi:hypothetical protein GIB67_008218 [Kingdonia uniflora]|uniref:Chitinase n=1 Tax=Kingdonia uniflora TaxID=39325 RepID=A0A7J7N4H0_9MAGN|nr:hypothetical protein GIB67_008218 [Kingdonia uniflora]